MMKRTTQRETGVSRYHGDQNKDTLEIPRTSHHYGIEWYKGRRSSNDSTMPIIGVSHRLENYNC